MTILRNKDDMTATPPGTTHVIAWIPAYVTGRERGGQWDLYTLAEFEAIESPCEGGGEELHDRRDAAPPVLARWAERVLGYPVTLTASHRAVTWGVLHRNRSEPVFYIVRDR